MELLTSWTDDLPLCPQTGIGISPNEVYKKNGRRSEMHPNEDRSFHFSVEESFKVRVYGVFDGFSGSKVSDFAIKKLPAELCLGQISQNSTDEAVRETLRQSFINLDREYFNNIGETLAMRMARRLENPNDPHLLQLDLETLVGASATVSVLLDNKKLFVANAGDVRTVVCKTKSNGDVKALPLFIDHTVHNEDEVLRLSQLGLDKSDVAKVTEKTRCLGFHQVKGGYKEVDFLRKGKDEPILSLPDCLGPFQVEPSHLFMIIFTRSLAECLEQMELSDINTELCRITKEQFSENTTVSGVAQSVVDKVVRMHREHFETKVDCNDNVELRREDISLLVKNFNTKLASGQKRISGANLNNLDATSTPIHVNVETPKPTEVIIPTATTSAVTEATRSSTTTTSSADTFVKQAELSVDENGRIKPYVDFSHFHKQWALHRESMQNGKK